MNIPFNQPFVPTTALDYTRKAFESGHLSGDGEFAKKCCAWLSANQGGSYAYITPSATAALEAAAALCGISPGDEVIMPSFTFSSTANAFVGRGAAIRFVDVQPDTMNMDPARVEEAVTPKTKAIVPVHYAGVACDMDAIMDIARRHGLFVVEDAAQGICATYKDKPLGSIGHFSCISFHETKNIGMGEGGALLIQDREHAEQAEIIREKGTDRSRYFRGQVDKYSWVAWGSSYLQNEMSTAYLWSQLEMADAITARRLALWQRYHAGLQGLQQQGRIGLPTVPEYARQNGHIFYIKTKDLEERTALIRHMKERGIYLAFHYVPLHSAPAGRQFGTFCGEDAHTTKESERLVRLPLFMDLTDAQCDFVVECIEEFYRQ